jgi:hypothetical protein
MKIFEKIKGFFKKEEPREEVKEEVVEPILEPKLQDSTQDKGEPTGKVCEHCQKDIYSNEVIRVVANKTFHKRCAKQLKKLAKQMLWG